MSGGIFTDKEKLSKQDLYQAIHHELVASAMAVKVGHEINAEFKIGCMILGVPNYPLTSHPSDVLEAMKQDRENLYFADVHYYFIKYLVNNNLNNPFFRHTKKFV